ncbi:S-adenosyl-L-methionine-dependent methyltransferase [Aspergillus parasiticus]|uniref:S-adenosyl-L-methionine-dependent methyltransferase n=1 Tax=Aspergillus parasiticus TaxID=5067 RepID=A0A5N6DML2_ASPPA|nr:S-adenosyl-L-methionine-dependent methyltransferase [Aspergillus parasiticus]
MAFKTLDIEQPPDSQGFALGEYDLVIAANVLHATAQIDQTAKHVRSLLKPGGTLLLIESILPTIHTSFIFGTLPGWRRGSFERQRDHPLLTEDEWHQLLTKSDFTGVETCMHAYQPLDQRTDSLIISHAVSSSGELSECTPLLVVSQRQRSGHDGGSGLSLAQSLAGRLSLSSDSITILGDPKINGRTCIVLAGLEDTTLATCGEVKFVGIRSTFNLA